MKQGAEHIRVLMKRVGEPARLEEIENNLEALQAFVGGYVETYYFADDAVIVCNEEGRINGSNINCKICGEWFFGDILICGVCDDEFCDFTLEKEEARAVFRNLFERK